MPPETAPVAPVVQPTAPVVAPVAPTTPVAPVSTPAAPATTPAAPTAPVTSMSGYQDQVAQQLGFKDYQDAIANLSAPTPSETDIYNKAYGAAGLNDLQNKITSRQNDLAGATNTINDNPWLDEASRVGRIKNLQDLANADIKNTQDEYNSRLSSVKDLMGYSMTDDAATAKANAAKLALLEANAKQLSDQATTAPKTVTDSTGNVYAWNPTTKSFDPLNFPSSDQNVFGTNANGSGTSSGINQYGIKATSTTQGMGGTPSTVKASDGGTFLSSQGDTGDRAIAQQLLSSPLYANLTVDQALKQWSGNGYNATILKGTGVDPQAKIGDLTKGAPQQIQTILDAIKKQEGIAPQSSTTGAPSDVTMTADGIPDPTQQQAFISAIKDPNLQALIKGITDYTINPNSLPTRNYKGVGSLTQSQALALASRYDPSYDSKQYATRQSTLKAFTSGKYSQNINALNTAIGHISDLLGNMNKIGNMGGALTLLNGPKNFIESKVLGSGNVTGAATNLNAATGELASVFKSGGATDTEIKNLGAIDANSTPEQVKAYIQTATQLLASRLQALTDTYTAGMGKAPANSFLSPTSQAMLQNLAKQGLNIQVPGITPAGQSAQDRASTAGYDYNAMVKAGYTDDQINAALDAQK